LRQYYKFCEAENVFSVQNKCCRPFFKINFTGHFASTLESVARGNRGTPLSFIYACVFRNMWFGILFISLFIVALEIKKYKRYMHIIFNMTDCLRKNFL
jgi:hypothetical protein